MKNIILKARFSTLSHNAEKHIRKHYKEFGFESRESFSLEKIITTARHITKKAKRVFTHKTESNEVLIFYDGTFIVMVDTKTNAIKTMFEVIYEEYVKRKLQRNYWQDIK